MSINKERKINKTRHYPCNCFHLQSIQAYRCNYENPQYYCRKHWCHSYDCCSYTRQYLWRKTPKVRKISTFNHHLHKGTRSTHTQKKTKDTKKPSFICKDLISITILSLVYISVVYMKKQRIRTCYYQCSYFHLQCIQAYRYNYEIPRYYYTQHWCHSYGCWLYTRQYLGRKALNVVKSIIFTSKCHRGGIRLKPRIKNRLAHKEAKD